MSELSCSWSLATLPGGTLRLPLSISFDVCLSRLSLSESTAAGFGLPNCEGGLNREAKLLFWSGPALSGTGGFLVGEEGRGCRLPVETLDFA